MLWNLSLILNPFFLFAFSLFHFIVLSNWKLFSKIFALLLFAKEQRRILDLNSMWNLHRKTAEEMKEDLDEKGLKADITFVHKKELVTIIAEHKQRQLFLAGIFRLTLLTSWTFSRLPLFFLYQKAMKMFLRKDIKFY